MSTYEEGEAVGISKQAGRPGRAAYRPGRILRVLQQPHVRIRKRYPATRRTRKFYTIFKK